jgi:hypothetical protein
MNCNDPAKSGVGRSARLVGTGDMGKAPMLTYRRILSYVAVLPFTLVIFGSAWALIAPERLYHCWDDFPPFLVSWHPPFIHPWANSADGNLRDGFIWPAWSVYLVWTVLAAGVFLIPAFAARTFVRRERYGRVAQIQ